MSSKVTVEKLLAIRDDWLQAWPAALAVWSRYVQLREPQWCLTVEVEKQEQLSGSFAMIRLVDHAIVISVRQVEAAGLAGFAPEMLAHEIGHHVYCPADLTDNTRLLARIRRGLPTKEAMGPMVSNLYSDLLINDRLQRTAELNIAGVYVQLGGGSDGRLWNLYMRIYEMLWRLPSETLAHGNCDARLNQDAQLGARLIRSYARDWLGGAGRFAALCLPYIIEDDERNLTKQTGRWYDTLCAGRGGFPDGLVEIDTEEADGAIHPAEDPELTGIDDLCGERSTARVPGELSGRKTPKNFRQPFEYAELLKATGVELDERDITARYYRELAVPHLVPFPVRQLPRATDPVPEGLELWDVDEPLEQIDWLGTLLQSSSIIPGVTTRQRLQGDSPGTDPATLPVDLYLGIDCSGSMGDPAHHLSYPVLAGAIIALSALRVGASVKVVLSGEPGQTISTAGFVRNSQIIMRTLASYLGTGYSFGIHRLAETFKPAEPVKRPVHILIVSDNDMFRMLDEKGNRRIGWDVASEALALCGGGGTFVLQLPGFVLSDQWGQPTNKYLARMQDGGWHVNLVDSMEQLVAFARDFAH
ncbi:MAG TPA: hypothetical protein VL096_15290, partial [Pirellulaceae bacterium]|nr:hypothetical protein [Pirellulaceae bacterium]